MEQVQHTPSPWLGGAVGPCSGWLEKAAPPAVHLGLPSPWLTFIVTLHEPLTVVEAGGPVRYPTLVGGLHTRPAVVTHDGDQSGVQLALHPLACRSLLGVPAGALGAGNTEAVDVAGRWVAQLQERLVEADGWSARFALVERALAGVRRDVPRPAPELRRAWTLLTGPRPPGVEAVAADVGWSGRHLRARLVAETGLSPRTLARVSRFDRARRALGARAAAGVPLDLAGLAATHGYYDQAHLAGEFRALSGLSPSAWVAAEHPVLVPERPSAAGAGGRTLDT